MSVTCAVWTPIYKQHVLLAPAVQAEGNFDQGEKTPTHYEELKIYILEYLRVAGHSFVGRSATLVLFTKTLAQIIPQELPREESPKSVVARIWSQKKKKKKKKEVYHYSIQSIKLGNVANCFLR